MLESDQYWYLPICMPIYLPIWYRPVGDRKRNFFSLPKAERDSHKKHFSRNRERRERGPFCQKRVFLQAQKSSLKGEISQLKAKRLQNEAISAENLFLLKYALSGVRAERPKIKERCFCWIYADTFCRKTTKKAFSVAHWYRPYFPTSAHLQIGQISADSS